MIGVVGASWTSLLWWGWKESGDHTGFYQVWSSFSSLVVHHFYYLVFQLVNRVVNLINVWRYAVLSIEDCIFVVMNIGQFNETGVCVCVRVRVCVRVCVRAHVCARAHLRVSKGHLH